MTDSGLGPLTPAERRRADLIVKDGNKGAYTCPTKEQHEHAQFTAAQLLAKKHTFETFEVWRHWTDMTRGNHAAPRDDEKARQEYVAYIRDRQRRQESLDRFYAECERANKGLPRLFNQIRKIARR